VQLKRQSPRHAGRNPYRDMGCIHLFALHYCSVRLKCTTLHYCSVMSETKSQNADDEQVDNQTDDDERELLQLTDAEVHAFELGVKEIVRDIEPTEADDLAAEHNPRQRALGDIDKTTRTENGICVYHWMYFSTDQNDLLAAVAENPLVELVKIRTHDSSAVLVHTDYVDEYVELTEQEDDQ